MERRKFVIGAGALATGSAAAMGTGAFSGTQVAASRSAEVTVAEDDEAYLGLDEGPGAEFTTREDGSTLSIDLSRVNSNSEFIFGEELTIENNFDREITVNVNKRLDGSPVEGDQVRLYAPWELDNGTAVADNRIDDSDLTLESGESEDITIVVSTGEDVDSESGDAHRESDLDVSDIDPDSELVDAIEFTIWS